MKKIFLITGAKGQDGLILSDILTKKGHEVFGIIKKKKKYSNYVERVKYVKLDLLKKKQVSKLLSRVKPDVVVHFGSSNPSYYELNKNKDFYKKNFQESKNLIDALISEKKDVKFIFANSAQIIANKNTKKKINEKNRFDYNSSYTKFRLNIFKYLEKKKNSKFRFSNLILFNHDSKFRNVKFLLPRIAKYVKERDIYSLSEIYNQNISGDFSHAEDICYAIYLLSVKNVVIDNLILSSGKKTKINDVIKFLVKLSGLNHRFPTPKNSKQMVCGDITFAKRILKWKIKKNVFIASKEIYKTLK